MLDPNDSALRKRIGAALGLADWYGEWPFPTPHSPGAKVHASHWSNWSVAIDAVIEAINAASPAPAPKEE